MFRVHLLISGDVQGVGFRVAAKRKAQELGVSGWVKNLPDGRVELVLESQKSLVDQMKNWCYSESPGRVESVEEKKERLERIDGLEEFEIR